MKIILHTRNYLQINQNMNSNSLENYFDGFDISNNRENRYDYNVRLHNGNNVSNKTDKNGAQVNVPKPATCKMLLGPATCNGHMDKWFIGVKF